MIKKLLNGIIGLALIIMFLLQTAQGTNPIEVLADESNTSKNSHRETAQWAWQSIHDWVQTFYGLLRFARNDDVRVKGSQTQLVTTLPHEIFGVPTDVWENYIINYWFGPETFALVSKSFYALARKMSCFKHVYADESLPEVFINPAHCHYVDLFQDHMSSFKFVHIFINQGFELKIEQLEQLLNANIRICTLNMAGQFPFNHKDFCNIISENLKKNTVLKSLNLDRFSIDNESATVLIESLKFNTTLIELNLKNNEIRAENITNLQKETIESLKFNTILKELKLQGNWQIGAENIISLQKEVGEIQKKKEVSVYF